ncbi:MAG: shikimate kinase [Clostridia bacterium]|nr:shikimate kinase [Clostridia bacterium]
MNTKQHPPLRTGLLGEKLSHSFSPQIHRALVGDRYTYELFERAPEAVEGFIKGDEWDALNVTIPYKQVVMPYLDIITDEALRIGAVNTVTRLPDGRLKGDNTDYFGFDRTLRACGVDVQGKKALILGNGGAAATAVAVLRDRGAEVVLLGRSDRSVGGISPEPYETVYERHPDAAVVVNCTPVGMYPKLVGQSPVELSRLPLVTAVFDMVYNPARTALLQEADTLGIPAYNGLLMLVAQAKRACELFLGEELEDRLIDAIVADIARETGNIVLVGMPGSGKSTVGKALAEAMGRPLVDTDALIVEDAGRPIPEIFATDGEEVFRTLETEAVKKAGMMSGAVIATGGGVVTRERNYAPLSQNGKIVFIHRDPGKLPTAGRPISQSTPMEELYARRLPLYKSFADLEADNNGTVENTVETILKALGYRE